MNRDQPASFVHALMSVCMWQVVQCWRLGIEAVVVLEQFKVLQPPAMFHEHIQSTYLQHTFKYWSCMNAFDNQFTMANKFARCTDSIRYAVGKPVQQGSQILAYPHPAQHGVPDAAISA